MHNDNINHYFAIEKNPQKSPLRNELLYFGTLTVWCRSQGVGLYSLRSVELAVIGQQECVNKFINFWIGAVSYPAN